MQTATDYLKNKPHLDAKHDSLGLYVAFFFAALIFIEAVGRLLGWSW